MATMPREAALEFYLNGWTPITARQTQTITMRRGRIDWSRDMSPGAFSARLSDDGGHLNPMNPVGDYYGLLNRNTPFRFTYTLLRDTYGRTVTDGWSSTTPDGVDTHVTTSLAYTLSGTAADFDVASGVGTMTIGAASTQRRAYLPGAVHGPINILLEIPTFEAPASGNNVQSILLRGTSLTDHVAVEVDVTSAGVVRLAIRDTNDTTYLYGPTTVAGVVRTSPMSLLAQIEGNTIRGKVWNPSGNNEPYGFHGSGRSTLVASSGWVGVRAATGAGNTNTFNFGNLTVSSPRFFGLASLTPGADSTGSDRWAELEGAGTLRRLERNKTPIATTIRRYIEASPTVPLAYWPFDDGPLSLSGRLGLGTGAPAIIRAFAAPNPAPDPSRVFSAGSLSPWLDPSAAAHKDALLQCEPLLGDTSTKWITHITAAFDGTYGTDNPYDQFAVYMRSFVYSGNGDLVFLELNSFNQTVVVHRPDTSTSSITSVEELYDGGPHLISLKAEQSGADVVFVVYIDNVLKTGGSQTALTLTNPRVIQFYNAFGIEDRRRSISSLVVYSGEGPDRAELLDAVRGHAGETAGRRIERLCGEEGIALSYVGDLDATVRMGPQKPLTAFELLQECATTDFGTLVDSRMNDGLVYITGAALTNRDAALTLSLAAGQLAGEFAPAFDIQGIQNRIRMNRVDGGTYTATQTSGPNNINDPGDDPDGAGINDGSALTVNTEADNQLADAGEWALHIGTSPDPRLPLLTVEAGSPNITATLDNALLSLDIDDRIVVNNLLSRDLYEPLSLLGRGYTELLDTIFGNRFTINCEPESPYRVFVVDTNRLDSDTTTLNEDLTTTETGADVAIADGTLWTTTEEPFEVMVAGERADVTVVTGASSPQTFTVTRSVNGVVKTHATGAAVRLADPVYLAVTGD